MGLDALMKPKSRAKAKQITLEISGELDKRIKEVARKCKKPYDFVLEQLLDTGVTAYWSAVLPAPHPTQHTITPIDGTGRIIFEGT